MPFPKKGEKIIGGHDMSMVAYDDETVIGGKRGWFTFQNHWGTDWGCMGGAFKTRGFCKIHEDLISRQQLDLTVVHYGHPWEKIVVNK